MKRLSPFDGVGSLVAIATLMVVVSCASGPRSAESLVTQAVSTTLPFGTSTTPPTEAISPTETAAPTETTAPAEIPGPTVTSAPPTSLAPVFELAPAVTPTGTVTLGALDVDGRQRTYRLYVPNGLAAGPAPLFIGLHGGGGWGDQFATTDHIEGLAESNEFIVVHPDGIKIADGRGGVWNGGVCCAIAVRESVDDVGFINALIDLLEAGHDIDPSRVFAYGHSNGAIMSYRLGCELSERITGIGMVAGTLGVEPCAPAMPVSAIHIHGVDDLNVPINGGVGPSGVSGVDFPSPIIGFDTFAAAVGCPDATAAASETIGDVTTALRAPCLNEIAAKFVTIETANHAWPGGTPIVTPKVGSGYAGYDATAEIVEFLLSHPRP